MPVSPFVEALSALPTRRFDTVASLEPITPGGLSPANNVPTLGKMQAGSLTAKYVVLIEGCRYILSEAPAASTLAAYAGHDSTEVLGGLFVELENTQSIAPDEPMPTSGRCIVRVMDTDGTDAFGIYVNKRTSGDKTTITATVDRNDTAIPIARGDDFAASGDVYCGTEAIGYSSMATDEIAVATRGKYSALGCDPSGSGGSRFARHHRVSTDVNTTLSNPVISEVPRNWVGKFVSVFLHTWDEATEQLNTKASAQLIYAGRIVGISDDAQTMCTSLEIEHISNEFKNGVVGRDMLAADIAPGLFLVLGRKLKFSDIIYTGAATWLDATDLEVVQSGATGAYQINEGYYNGDELAAAINRWLAQAKTDGDINGSYQWAYAVNSNTGTRTKCWWNITHANSYSVQWAIHLPSEVAAFLGTKADADPGAGQQIRSGMVGATNFPDIYIGDAAPYSTLILKPFAGGSLGQLFGLTTAYELENERGAFVSQADSLPAAIKEYSQGVTATTGLFLLDEKILITAVYTEATGTLTSCRLAPFQAASDNTSEASVYIGRRMDESPGPVSLRQVVLIEGRCRSVVNQIVYSTGTTGYNHGNYDVLPPGFGLGIPGSVLGPEWERSLENLPGANSLIAIMIDEPIKFADLFRDDFRLRRAFIRWHNQGFSFGTWRTPLVALADHALTESNKAAPVGTEDGHRIASQESDQWHFSTVKVDYCRDFATGRNAQFLKSITLEDQAGTDGSGALGGSITLKMRNTFPAFANAGAPIEELIKEYLVGMPMFSRPSRTIVRSIDLRYFETIAVGDICVITDSFARDPLTGQRGIESRAALVTRVSYNLGGPTPQASVRDMVGEVELFFLDTQRGGIYSPAADVDHEWNLGGFLAGYNSTTKQLRLAANKYTWTQSVPTRRGDVSHSLGRDADYFNVGDLVTVVEIDPPDPTAPDTWNDTIAAISGDTVTLTTGLAGWDSAKRHRIFYQQYTSCTATQQDLVFQADATDEMIQDEEVADQFSSTNTQITFTPTSTTDKAELVATLTYGDGKPLDVGTDAALAKTINAFIDYKSAHQQPCMWSEFTAIGTPGETFDTMTNSNLAGVYNFGSEILSGTITRTLTIALWLRSTAGAAAYARVVLSRLMPANSPSNQEAGVLGTPFVDPVYIGESSMSDTVTTTSTTWGTTADLTVSIAVKDLQWGCAWLVIELSGEADCRGIAKCVEGARS